MMLLHFARGAMLIVLRYPLLRARFVMNAAWAAAERNMAVPGNIAPLHDRAILIDMSAPSTAHANMHHGGVI
jgi:hypothetical protein